MPIIRQILSLANTLGDLLPRQRKTPCCHKLGAYKHGSFWRYPPERFSLPGLVYWIQRFLCLHCGKTFCILPFFILSRIAITLPDLLALAASRLSWADLMKDYEISRKTLWRWRKTGKAVLKFLPGLLMLLNLSWRVLSHYLSRLQYPRFHSEPSPTVPGN